MPTLFQAMMNRFQSANVSKSVESFARRRGMMPLPSPSPRVAITDGTAITTIAQPAWTRHSRRSATARSDESREREDAR